MIGRPLRLWQQGLEVVFPIPRVLLVAWLVPAPVMAVHAEVSSHHCSCLAWQHQGQDRTIHGRWGRYTEGDFQARSCTC